ELYETKFLYYKVMCHNIIGNNVRKEKVIAKFNENNYTGGSQVQCYEAMKLLRMMTFAPVMIATQNEEVEKVCQKLNEGIMDGIQSAYMVNAQSKVIIVELTKPIAQEVIKQSNRFGAATHPEI